MDPEPEVPPHPHHHDQHGKLGTLKKSDIFKGKPKKVRLRISLKARPDKVNGFFNDDNQRSGEVEFDRSEPSLFEAVTLTDDPAKLQPGQDKENFVERSSEIDDDDEDKEVSFIVEKGVRREGRHLCRKRAPGGVHSGKGPEHFLADLKGALKPGPEEEARILLDVIGDLTSCRPVVTLGDVRLSEVEAEKHLKIRRDYLGRAANRLR